MASDSSINPQSAIKALYELPEYAHVLWVHFAPRNVQKALSSTAERIGISEKYLICIMSATIFYILAGKGTDLFYRILSTAYPAYMSFKALESVGTDNEHRFPVRRSLQYWVMFGALSMLDFVIPAFAARIISFWLIKTILVVWCMLPIEPNGSEVIYDLILASRFRTLRTYLKKYDRPAVAYQGTAQQVAAEVIFRAQQECQKH